MKWFKAKRQLNSFSDLSGVRLCDARGKLALNVGFADDGTRAFVVDMDVFEEVTASEVDPSRKEEKGGCI